VLRTGDTPRDRGLVLLVVELLAGDKLRAAVRELHDDGRLRLPRGLERRVGRV
jgi:hypothetical protein